ncbi:glutamate-5-semialdehyde dehydrogenase [Helicobacter anseris]|uniref:Gamma-glutamyl phosphate reductase n=1 Tax=Helicobacter anseris TaxID=375926 RepID=A0A3D8J3G0_9HELI|nr:glutamate-5-semialdehyde dehydrogenase [Helicobacter anseris]RDU72028.1 glutamate-5-semialdehyde dehydrogenase [Helicobacter anseris]
MLDKIKQVKKASFVLAASSLEKRNALIEAIARNFENHIALIIEANKKDMQNAKDISSALLDRLYLDEKRIASFISGLKKLICLPDPIGKIQERIQRNNGLEIIKKSVPLGVVGMIYESRPNVTSDAIGICLKSANAVVLKGGSEALYTNKILVELAKEALLKEGFPTSCIELIEDRDGVSQMLHLRGLIDVIIPRGSDRLIKFVVENSQVPVLETGSGNCHIFVDKSADFDMAAKIIINAKTSRVSVCNAIEKLLVHQDIAKDFLPFIILKLREKNVEVLGCKKSKEIVLDICEAQMQDYFEEYLDYKICIKVVCDADEAIEHINHYSSHHSEAIITQDLQNVEKFFQEVDSAVLYHNASTRFSDGDEFGFGAEIGISTQKIHTRGPMGLEALCSYKYLVSGKGQIR